MMLHKFSSSILIFFPSKGFPSIFSTWMAPTFNFYTANLIIKSKMALNSLQIVSLRSSMLTFSGLLEILTLVGGFCQTTSQQTSSPAHVGWFPSIFLDQKQLHLGGGLLGDFSCTTTCFGAVIG